MHMCRGSDAGGRLGRGLPSCNTSGVIWRRSGGAAGGRRGVARCRRALRAAFVAQGWRRGAQAVRGRRRKRERGTLNAARGFGEGIGGLRDAGSGSRRAWRRRPGAVETHGQHARCRVLHKFFVACCAQAEGLRQAALPIMAA